MPLAIQYGMSEYQFWHGDLRLLQAYQKAYLRDKTYTAWVQGVRSYEAFSVTLNNAFSNKKNKKEKYSDWEDPFKNEKKQFLTKEEKELKFRKTQAQQSEWINALLKYNKN